MGQLEGKSILITGAAQGMGAVHARRFVEEGARVLLTDLQAEAGEKLAAELGDAARFEAQDITSAADWDRVVARTVEHGDGLHGLVNNAAIWWTKPFVEEGADALRQMLEVNVVGSFLGMQKVVLCRRARWPSRVPWSARSTARRAPDAEPFCEVGDRATADTVVCIVEAMKVMNEIKAECAGEVRRDPGRANGEPVEFGQPLFVVKKG